MRIARAALAAAVTLSVPALNAQPSEAVPRVSASASASLPNASPVAHASVTPAALTLDQALARARTSNPVLLAKQAQLEAAQGSVSEASSFLHNNPSLSVEGTRRTIAAEPSNQREWNVGLAQTFETGGQSGYRRAASTQALRALQREIDDLVLQQAAEVSQRFYKVLALQQRQRLEAESTRLFEETARAIEKRRAAGEDTRLDANLALVEAERARSQLGAVEEQLIDARSALAQPLQWPRGALPVVSGDLSATSVNYSESTLLQAVKSSPRMEALAARAASAESRWQLERAARSPDVTVGVNVGREGPVGARERLTTLSVSVPLPLFQRNQAAIGSAASEREQARLEREAADRDLPAQISASWLRLESLGQRAQRLQQVVLPALERNEALSEKSLRAGQIGLLELIVARRQALDARRELIDALLDYQTTRLSLEATAGWTPSH